MKKLVLLFAAIYMTASCFAGTSAKASKLQNLGLAFKNHSTAKPTLDKNDLEIVYGGADVERTNLQLTPVAV